MRYTYMFYTINIYTILYYIYTILYYKYLFYTAYKIIQFKKFQI